MLNAFVIMHIQYVCSLRWSRFMFEAVPVSCMHRVRQNIVTNITCQSLTKEQPLIFMWTVQTSPMLSSEWLHFCLFQDDSNTTTNKVLSVSIQAYRHEFFQQKKHTIRASIGPSQSPWGEGKFIIVYTDHVEKRKRALRLLKANLVKEAMIKGQFYKSTV